MRFALHGGASVSINAGLKDLAMMQSTISVTPSRFGTFLRFWMEGLP